MKLLANERTFLAELNLDKIINGGAMKTCEYCVYYDNNTKECDKTPALIMPESPACDMYVEQISMFD